MKRVRYTISITFMGEEIDEIIIDQHYRLKHPEVNDRIVIELAKKLDCVKMSVSDENDQFKYFVADEIFYQGRPYRMIVLLEKGCSYLGVVNAFRIKEKKNGIS